MYPTQGANLDEDISNLAAVWINAMFSHAFGNESKLTAVGVSEWVSWYNVHLFSTTTHAPASIHFTQNLEPLQILKIKSYFFFAQLGRM